jgi:protein-S-isoprenylcysteine O-methyltransferase Ste14
VRVLVNLIGIALAGVVAVYVALNPPDAQVELWLLALGPIATVLAAAIGRWALARWPTAVAAVWTTVLVHYTFAIAGGAALIAAVSWAIAGWGAVLSLPDWACDGLAILLGVPGWLLFGAAVINLGVKGLGAPFAVALTRRLASDWLYARTRNPMMLGAFLSMLSLAFSWRSGLFLLWSAIGFIPAVIIFLKLFEERELELRFGQCYLAYRARTPFLFPRLRA